ncbi:MAG: dihydroneopterin aldolase [Pseudomonadota bacterium]
MSGQTVTALKPAPRPIVRGADADAGTRHVFVRDLEINIFVGVHPHEKEARQRVIVSIDLTVLEDGKVEDDHIDEVVCYEKLIDRVKEIAAQRHFNLIELLAERFAETALVDRRVVGARVRIEKPEAFADAHSVGVEIERVRR